MKKKLLITLTALATGLIFLHSCNTKEIVPSRGESEYVEVVLSLNKADTKTINAQEKTLWAKDDRISAILTQYDEEDYVANYLTYKGDDTFTGHVSYPGDKNDWFFVYPYRADNVTPKKIHITVDKELKQTGNNSMDHIAGDGFPLIGKASGLTRGEPIEVTMKNVLARFDYQVTNTLDDPIIVKQIVITAPKKISGDFVGDMTKDNITWTAESGASQSVTLNVKDGTEIAKDEMAEFHVGILPITIAAGEITKVKVVSEVLSTPATQIVYYEEFSKDFDRTLESGYSYKCELSFDDKNQTDPHPDTPAGNNVFTKVTSVDDIDTDSKYVIVYRSGSTVKAFKPILNSDKTAFSTDTNNAIDVTITDDEIEADDDVEDCVIRLANQDGTKFALVVPEADGTNDYYLRLRSSSSTIFGASTTLSTDYLCTIAISDTGVLTITRSGSSTYNFRYSPSSKYFTASSSITSSNLELFKLSDTSGKAKQKISFASSTVTHIMETATGRVPIQALTGAMTEVEYSSQNEDVATVSGNDLIIKGFGSTLITATAKETDEYKPATASYTLVIKEEGVFNLENDLVYNYLNEASITYTAENHSTKTLIKSSGDYIYSYNGINYNKPSSTYRWDCPKPVTITWPTDLSGSKDVYIYTDADHTQPVDYIDQPISASSSSNSVDVYNLIPEKAGKQLTYYYVVKSGDTDVASGKFTTEGRRRMMKISSSYSQSHANNCRDFGGQETISGDHLKFGKMYRGTNMDSTTSDEQKIIKQYMNIGLDVDLRESKSRSNPLKLDQIEEYDADTYQGHTQESYSGTTELNNAKNMGATLKRVMNAVVNGVNVYIHCAIGADRTGYTCMMLEAILGVPLERCDMDYEMTSFSTAGTRTRSSSSMNFPNSGIELINAQSGSTFQEKAVNYAVNTLGISEDLIEAFQEAMLE